ncbi:hypothetical protein [Halomicrococcus gelatinilyticus]|uniref:hypothetical protein n=1 Tax=Halomicrococcus gelatinilyticus TaxID=1702103 RepID=UPI002E12B44B
MVHRWPPRVAPRRFVYQHEVAARPDRRSGVACVLLFTDGVVQLYLFRFGGLSTLAALG